MIKPALRILARLAAINRALTSEAAVLRMPDLPALLRHLRSHAQAPKRKRRNP